MVATNLKAETFSLMDKRTAIEAEMNAIIERLCQPGGPGITGNLLDEEGFPRPDIDIPVVRADRNRLAELRNDFKNITEKIDGNIQVLHSARLASRSASTKDSEGISEGLNNQNSSAFGAAVSASSRDVFPGGAQIMDLDISAASIPFGIVDEISEASPAADGGLQLGDHIVKFGSVESGDNLLQRLSLEAQTNQGQVVPISVMRQGAVINLSVTPRTWQGQGLLGFHLRLL